MGMLQRIRDNRTAQLLVLAKHFDYITSAMVTAIFSGTSLGNSPIMFSIILRQLRRLSISRLP